MNTKDLDKIRKAYINLVTKYPPRTRGMIAWMVISLALKTR